MDKFLTSLGFNILFKTHIIVSGHMVLIVLCSTFYSDQSSEKNAALWTLDSADWSSRQRTNRRGRRNISNKHFIKKDIKAC